MKWIYAFAVIATFAASAFAYDLEEEEGDARLGYIGIDNSGQTSITFNATSIQNGVVLVLFILVLGSLIIPLFTTPAAADTGYGYRADQNVYEDPNLAYASGFTKRSSPNDFGPVLDALSAGYKKYEDEEEE